LKQNVHARVTAQLLRNTWVVGPLVSTVLWPVSKLFEYKITGTLKNPKSEPVYVPKLLLLPLHPIRTLGGNVPRRRNGNERAAGELKWPSHHGFRRRRCWYQRALGGIAALWALGFHASQFRPAFGFNLFAFVPRLPPRRRKCPAAGALP
jgi:hypothetical protein